MARFGRKDELLAVAVASGKTLCRAAALVGLSERTSRRRWADSAFRARVSDLRGEMVGRALGRMARHMARAAGTLAKLLDAEHESVRLGAARALLELGVKLRETVELEQRLAAIEERLAKRENGP
jgi:hypothetical protein